MANTKDFKIKNGIKPTVYNEGVGTVVSGSEGYNLASGFYSNKSFSLASQDGIPRDIAFKSDGTKMYMSGQGSNSVFQYSLSTAWDVSTASYDSVSLNVSTQTTSNTHSLTFKADGTSMYVTSQNNSAIYQYTLSTAWDLSTASYASKSLNVSSQDLSPKGIEFKSDGTKFYFLGYSNKKIFQYSLSTAWDISTASYDSVSLSSNTQASFSNDFVFNVDGTKILIANGNGSEAFYEYSLSTAWDISTATYTNISLDATAQTNSGGSGLFWGDSGTKLYFVDTGNDAVYQYSTVLSTASLDLSTGAVFNYTPTSDVQITLSNPADSGTVSQATLLLNGGASEGGVLASGSYTGNSFDYSGTATSVQGIKIDNSGTALYILSLTGDIVYQFTLSTPYDVSTASYDSKSFDTSTQASSARSLEFSSDGTKMYIGDQGTAAIYQYTLSTAFDVSTASYASKSLSISSQDTQFREVRFKADGTSLYVYGDTNVRIYQYDLSTAWDLSTASYASKFMSPSSQSTAVRSFDISEDSTKLFVFSYSNTSGLFQYTLSTAGDISTASYDSVNYTGYATEVVNNAYGFDVENSDVSLYINDQTATTIFQYNIANGATITYDTTLEWPSGTAPTSPAIGDTDVITFTTSDGGTSYQAVQAIDGAK